MLRKSLCWLACSAYALLIFQLSSRPSVPVPMLFPHQDKLFHLVEYGLLGFLLANALSPPLRRRLLLAGLLASLYGVSDELHQSFVPGRDASAGDWLADSCGGLLGAWSFLRLEGLLRGRKNKARA